MIKKLAEDMTLKEIKEYCKKCNVSCDKCVFSSEEDSTHCSLGSFAPERWDMENIEVTILDENDIDLYEEWNKLPDVKKFEYFRECIERRDHNVS